MLSGVYFMGQIMLFMKDEYFENTDFREVNAWASAFGAERSPRDMILGFRFLEACEKFQVKNALALWCLGVTKTAWFSRAPKDRDAQIKWIEGLASDFARLGDIRLMPGLTPDETVIMTLVWTQVTARLNEYAKFKKPVEPKLPDPKQKPETVEVKKKGEEPKQREEIEAKPKPSDQKSTEPVEEPKKSGAMKVIGSIATVLALIVAWLPIPPQFKAIAKIVLNAIASIFR